jgi:hypothetical protein
VDIETRRLQVASESTLMSKLGSKRAEFVATKLPAGYDS